MKQLQDYDAYLFDWDGTLAQSHETWLEIFHGQMHGLGFKLNDKEVVEKIFGRAPKDWAKEFDIAEQDIRKLEKETPVIAKERIPLADLYPDANELLRHLVDAGKKVALVTSSFREVVDLAITNHQLLDLFDVVVTGDEVRAVKPDPDAVLTALRKLGVAPDKAIMIGDSPKDIMAGNNAGTDTLLFYPPSHEAQHDFEKLKQCNPTHIVRSWRELLDTIQ